MELLQICRRNLNQADEIINSTIRGKEKNKKLNSSPSLRFTLPLINKCIKLFVYL